MIPFDAARVVARKLKLGSVKEWKEWSKSGLRPPGIPSSPDKTYRGDGWVSWPDWLGNGGTSHNNMLPFDVARVIARKLKLRTVKEWHEWSKSGLRPPGMPGNPADTYRGDGWVSYPDWLGTGGKSPNNMLPFDVARVIARKLKLRTQKEWQEWSKSGLRPPGMPSHPDRAYRGNGWVSYPDWLGYGPTRPKAPTGGKRKRLKTEPAASQFAVRVQL